MHAEILANATTADLVTFVNELRFRTVNHGSAFMVRAMNRRIAECEAEIARRSALAIEA